MWIVVSMAMAQGADFGEDDVLGDLSAPVEARVPRPLYVAGELDGYPAAYPVRLEAGQLLEVEFTCRKRCRPALEIDGAGFDAVHADRQTKKAATFRRPAPASGVAVIRVTSVAMDEAAFTGPYTFFALRDGSGAASLPSDTPASVDRPVRDVRVEVASLGGGGRLPTEPQPLCEFVGYHPRDARHGFEGSRGESLGDGRWAPTVALAGGACHVQAARIECELARGTTTALREATVSWTDAFTACPWERPPVVFVRDPWAVGADPVGVRAQAVEPGINARIELISDGADRSVLRLILQ